MKKRKLLIIVLLSLSFCFVSGVGYGVGLEKDSVSATRPKPGWSESLKANIQARRLPERYTFLVIPIGEDSRIYTLFMLESFLDIYSDPEIPEEFAYIFPTGIRELRQSTRIQSKREYRWIKSLFLTMAYLPFDSAW